ncbi:MAG: DUF6029 family protein [Bacteroidales bacterium]|nr:DUF6029 family protein [Bacteroidales bacterium]
MKKIQFTFTLLLSLISSVSFAQEMLQGGTVSGNFQIDGQYYFEDKQLGVYADSMAGKRYGFNGFGNLTYTNGNFSAGMRFESYLPPLTGFNSELEGSNIANWYADYKNELIQITVGNFYEQFGSGLILRSYEEWSLAYDNSLKGIRVKLNPIKGLSLKGLVGYHRYYWIPYENGNRGLVRGADAELYLNDLIPDMQESKTKVILGGSFVSKFEKMSSKRITRGDSIFEYKLPYNVAAIAGRLNIIHGGWNFMSEYAHKSNNPSAANGYIYKDGQALYSTLSWSTKGIGVMLGAKRIDNMSFKSKMTVEGGDALDINFLPPLAKQHQYSFATMYPFSSQPAGEMAYQAQVDFKIPKGTLGGKYGTQVSINYSQINNIKKEEIKNGIPVDSTGTLGYSSPFFTFGDELYYSDFSVFVTRKFDKTIKANLGYIYQEYNKDVLTGHKNEYPNVLSSIFIADVTVRLNQKHAVRFENQWLLTNQDKGNWSAFTVEYTIAPKWFMSVGDEYNYGNDNPDQRLHYYLVSAGYTQGSTRIAMNYGRQREGLLCIGGVCRNVPAANGLTLTITSSF